VTHSPVLEAVLKRDRIVVLAGLAGVTVLAWVYLWLQAAGPAAGMGESMGGAKLQAWDGVDFWLTFLMWAVMMVGMMVPSAAPAILLFAAISRKNQEQQPSLAPVGAFAWGYVLTWTGFSLAATSLQWGLEQAALLSPMMVSTSPVLGGLLLAAAGLYQMTPLKESCLVKCRSPLHFLVARWRPGSVGALRMGLEHGAFCVGCCWLLMGLLFFGGVMNLAWVAAIAIFVLIEKVMPWGSGIGRAGGILLIAGGLLVAFQP